MTKPPSPSDKGLRKLRSEIVLGRSSFVLCRLVVGESWMYNNADPKDEGRRTRDQGRFRALILCVSVSLCLVFFRRLGAASAQTLDWVMAAIGNRAVTESDAAAEVRFESFLSDCRVPAAGPGAEALAGARDRIIDQQLLGHEADLEAIQPSEVQPAAEKALAAVRQKCGSEGAFQSSLKTLRLTEAQLLDRLAEQQRVLRIIDLRLRPSVTVEPTEVEAYYRDSFTPEYAKHNPGQAVPPLAHVQSEIREILVQKKIDQLLASWLDELKTAHHVRVFR